MAATSSKSALVERFGTLTSLVKKRGRNGTFVVFTLDCKAFEASGIAFSPKAVEVLLAKGKGARVWMKGVNETRTVTVDGAEHEEEVFKAVYVSSGRKAAAPKKETDAASAEAPDTDAVIDDTAPASTEEAALDGSFA